MKILGPNYGEEIEIRDHSRACAMYAWLKENDPDTDYTMYDPKHDATFNGNIIGNVVPDRKAFDHTIQKLNANRSWHTEKSWITVAYLTSVYMGW